MFCFNDSKRPAARPLPRDYGTARVTLKNDSLIDILGLRISLPSR